MAEPNHSSAPVDVEAIKERSTPYTNMLGSCVRLVRSDYDALLSAYTRQTEELAAANKAFIAMRDACDASDSQAQAEQGRAEAAEAELSALREELAEAQAEIARDNAELTTLRASVERLTRMGVHERPDGIAEGYWYCGFCEAAWRGEREDRSHHYGPQDGFDGCPLAVAPVRLVSEAAPTPPKTENPEHGE